MGGEDAGAGRGGADGAVAPVGLGDKADCRRIGVQPEHGKTLSGGRHLADYAGILQADAYAGILQADAYAGFGELYDGKRKPGPITEAACWSHGRRHFFEQADLRKAPPAVEAVQRIDDIFAIERRINGQAAGDRLAVREKETKPIVADLEKWMRAERARVSRHAGTAQAIDYI